MAYSSEFGPKADFDTVLSHSNSKKSECSDGVQRTMELISQNMSRQLSTKKSFQSKLGGGKVVAEYLPQIQGTQPFTSEEEFFNLEDEEPIRLRLGEHKEKAQSSPVKGYNPIDGENAEDTVNGFESQEEENEEEMLVDASDSSSNNSNNSLIGDLDCESDDEEVAAREAENKRKEIEEIQEWARANGF